MHKSKYRVTVAERGSDVDDGLGAGVRFTFEVNVKSDGSSRALSAYEKYLKAEAVRDTILDTLLNKKDSLLQVWVEDA